MIWRRPPQQLANSWWSFLCWIFWSNFGCFYWRDRGIGPGSGLTMEECKCAGVSESELSPRPPMTDECHSRIR